MFRSDHFCRSWSSWKWQSIFILTRYKNMHLLGLFKHELPPGVCVRFRTCFKLRLGSGLGQVLGWGLFGKTLRFEGIFFPSQVYWLKIHQFGKAWGGGGLSCKISSSAWHSYPWCPLYFTKNLSGGTKICGSCWAWTTWTHKSIRQCTSLSVASSIWPAPPEPSNYLIMQRHMGTPGT